MRTDFCSGQKFTTVTAKTAAVMKDEVVQFRLSSVIITWITAFPINRPKSPGLKIRLLSGYTHFAARAGFRFPLGMVRKIKRRHLIMRTPFLISRPYYRRYREGEYRWCIDQDIYDVTAIINARLSDGNPRFFAVASLAASSTAMGQVPKITNYQVRLSRTPINGSFFSRHGIRCA